MHAWREAWSGLQVRVPLPVDDETQSLAHARRYVEDVFAMREPNGFGTLCAEVNACLPAFKNLKGDLALRPIYHQHESRIEAHIFIAFLAYCLHVTLGRQLHAHAPALTARSAIEQFAAVQMIDVHIPTTDGREIQLTCDTQPEPPLRLLLEKLRLELLAQPPPKITHDQIHDTDPV